MDLKTAIARQASDYYTSPEWPSFDALTKQINYVIRRDGLYEVRKNRVGVFVRKRESFTAPLPGFPEEKNVEFGRCHYGLIPAHLFQEIVSFFKSICDATSDEAYVQTFWDTEKKEFFNFVPIQRVSGASVHFERDEELEKRCVLVCETHSHNRMNAFFSGTDNADEKSDRFYVVIGKLDTRNPEALYSYVCGGTRYIVERSVIFDGDPEVSFPQEWKSRIVKYVTPTLSPTPAKTTYGSPSTESWRKYAHLQHEDQYDFDDHFTGYFRGNAPTSPHAQVESAFKGAKAALGGASSEQNFLGRSEKKIAANDDDKSALTTNLRKLIVALAGGDKMSTTRVQINKMFEQLVAVMSDDDIDDMVTAMLEAGHGDAIERLLPTAAIEVEDTITGE